MRPNSDDPVQDYIEEVFVNETKTMREVRQQATELGRSGMQVSPAEGQLLQFLAQSVNARKVVEIGTFLGYSTLHFAEVGDEIYAIEKDSEVAAKARVNFQRAGHDKRIRCLQGDALDLLLPLEENGPFDLVFIDANKSAYAKYLAWAERNLRSGGLLVADNTLLFGHVLAESQPEKVSKAQWRGMREFNQRLADTTKWRSVMIPTKEGLSVGVKL